MKHILVTGASGLLGLTFCLQHSEKNRITGVVHQNPLQGVPFETLQADLSVPNAAARLLETARPDLLIHCAAIANIDACERQPEQARQTNALLPAEFAEASRRIGIQMIHISTDAVFDGQRGGYTEEDETNPLSVYARTKREAELLVLAANPQAAVARVNFYGWSLRGQRSLGEFFYNNLSAGKRVNGFTDVFFCPLLANDLSDLLVEMAEKELSGIYHVLSREAWSKYDFGVAVARRFGLDETLITPTSVMDGGLAAARSPHLNLSTDKLSTALGHALPDQAEAMERFYALHRQGYPERIHSYTIAQVC